MAGTKSTRWRVKVVQPRGRETGLYLRAWRTVDGRVEDRRMSAGTPNEVDAERLRTVWETDLNGSGAPLDLGAVMDRRIADFETTARKGTVDGYRAARAAFAEVGGLLSVGEVDAVALRLVRDRLVASGRSKRTVNSYVRWAGCCWRWCEERGLVSTPWPRLRTLKHPETEKRPYTDDEVAGILAWLRTYRGGKWHALVLLVSETGRRISEVCELKGRDVDYTTMSIRVTLKGRKPYSLPLSTEAAALIPRVAAGEWLFRRRLREGGYSHASRGSVLKVVKQAAAETGIKDPERVDNHSFRRYACGALIRSGVPLPLAMKITGHKSERMFLHYQSQWVGDDLRDAVDVAKARRVSPKKSPKLGRHGRRKSWADPDSNRGLLACKVPREGQLTDDSVTAGDPGSWETRPATTGQPEPRRDRILGRLDPDFSTVARWADEAPETMRRLLTDAELQRHLLRALDDVVGPGEDASSAADLVG